MTPAEHYVAAETVLRRLNYDTPIEVAAVVCAEAQAHATLALAPGDTYQEAREVASS